MNTKIWLLAAAVTLTTTTFAQTATEVVDKHIAAVGGADNINALKSVEYDQAISIMGMDLTGKTTVVVNKAARTQVEVMGSDIITVIDGDKGWTINPMQGGTTPQELSTEQLNMQKNTTEVTGLQLAYAKMANAPMELVGKEKMDGKDVFNIKVTRPEAVANYYLDADTYQLVSAKASMTIQGQTQEAITKFSNFKTENGLTLPYTIDLSSPALPGPMTITIKKMTANPTVDPTIFAMPK